MNTNGFYLMEHSDNWDGAVKKQASSTQTSYKNCKNMMHVTDSNKNIEQNVFQIDHIIELASQERALKKMQNHVYIVYKNIEIQEFEMVRSLSDDSKNRRSNNKDNNVMDMQC